MGLEPGTRIGPYEIVGLLGQGGMGEVYRGHDPRLGRDVAIKVIANRHASDPERLRRFEVEARAAAALSHPNILAIFDVGAEGGQPYLVAEYLEGQTLRELLDAGAIPFTKALALSSQIAAGLTAAHERGIVHRDLKPENVFLTADGRVKILDFGIAKWVHTPEDHATTTVAGTHIGQIVGTVGYIAPEQATGRDVDCKCDQFAFGVVVYEMLSGRRAFERSSHVEELAAICRDDPPALADLRADVPLPMQWLLNRCLAKDPAERYESTRELHSHLETLASQMLQAAPPPRRAAAEGSKLPVSRTPLIGRETAVALATQVTRRPAARLITFTGPGGIGKTRLALEVVSTLRDEFPGGVYFAPLGTITDPGLVPQAVAQACGVAVESPLDALAGHFTRTDAPPLLLLDSFEHLLDAAPFVVDLLNVPAPITVVVTSREPLHLYEEHEVPVPPLPRPDAAPTTPLDVLARNAAVMLFVERATASKPDFALTSDNARTIAEICNRLDGLPLAIELAAARVKTLPPAAMLGRMESRLQILTGGARDRPARQQTLRGAIGWSHDLLGDAEQRLFRRLSVFVGGCTFEAAEAVADARQDLGLDVLDGLDSLVNKSLLQLVEQPDGHARVRMMETIREYGSERLGTSGEEQDVRKAHAAYFLVLAEEAAPALQGADQAMWVAALDRDLDNIRAALGWLLATGHASWGLRLATAMLRYWEIRELFAEGRRALAAMLALPGAAARNAARARAVFAAGALAEAQRDHRAGRALFGEALAIHRELGDQQGMAVALNALAVGYKELAEFDQARALLEECSALWLQLGDRQMLSRTLSNLAAIAREQGELDTALARYEEAEALFRQVDDHQGIAWSLRHRGDIARQRQDAVRAESLYLQALAEFEGLADPWSSGSVLTDLGMLALRTGDVKGGVERLAQAARALQELGGQKRRLARVLDGMAFAASLNGDAARAIRLAAAAAALRSAIGAPLTEWEQRLLNAELETAQTALTADERTRAWTEGWMMPLEQALDDGLAGR
jgi:predicted ATPase